MSSDPRDPGVAARVAIVTGAARGIGAAIARRLAAEGHTVAALDLGVDACADTVSSIVSLGGSARSYAADVTDEDATRAVVAQVALDLGPPTILVNNAGITRDNLMFKMGVDDWDAVMQVHLRGTFLMSREAQAHMRGAGWGRIVNLSSVSALGNRGQANYSAAKAGVLGFTRTAAIELGPLGVTVNAIAPGFIDTEMTAATARRMGMDFDEVKRQAAAQIPMGRVGRPEDIASTAAFFVREDAQFVTGQVLYVAGGPHS